MISGPEKPRTNWLQEWLDPGPSCCISSVLARFPCTFSLRLQADCKDSDSYFLQEAVAKEIYNSSFFGGASASQCAWPQGKMHVATWWMRISSQGVQRDRRPQGEEVGIHSAALQKGGRIWKGTDVRKTELSQFPFTGGKTEEWPGGYSFSVT